jgi:hypothetical protein
MGWVNGDDSGWQMGGYGVLGIGTPRSMRTEDGAVDVDSFGVWGLLGTSDDVRTIVGEVTSNDTWPPSPRRAAIFGRNALRDQGSAVYGEAAPADSGADADSFGFIAGRSPYAGEVTGVFGQGTERGVIGIAAQPGGIGVYGGGVGGVGTGVFGDSQSAVGVVGRTENGIGVYGQSEAGGMAGRFDGDVHVSGRLQHTGTIVLTGDLEVSGDVRLLNQDLAEDFDIAETEAGEIEPGSVLVLEEDGALVRCRKAYDRMVVGVVAGAGSFRPAIVLGCAPSCRRRLPLALTGKTYCRVDASHSPIVVGDLLTSSDMHGHAMKATDPSRAFGAVIGKALGALGSGCGLIPILVALQ